MSTLEKRKKELELERVKLAKKELEFKIEERLDEVERLKKHIDIQNETINKIEQEIKG